MVVGAWGQEKHDLLAKYVVGTRRMRDDWPRRTYVELFCGPGRVYYEHAGPCDGSALRAWRASQRGGEFTEFYVNDFDSESAELCHARLERAGAPRVEHFTEAADVAGPKILERLKGPGLHTVLLDPFSIAVLPFSLVKPFASHRKVDLIVNFNLQDLTRTLHLNMGGKSSALDAFAPGWREVIERGDSRRVIRGKVIQHWLKLLKACGIKDAEQKPLVTDSRKGIAKYHLVYASHHPSPLKVWDDVAKGPTRSLPF